MHSGSILEQYIYSGDYQNSEIVQYEVFTYSTCGGPIVNYTIKVLLLTFFFTVNNNAMTFTSIRGGIC